jgi:hypothetical protein
MDINPLTIIKNDKLVIIKKAASNDNRMVSCKTVTSEIDLSG